MSQALAQGGEATAARESAKIALRILNELPGNRKDNPRYRKDWARAQWILGNAQASAATEATEWTAAETILKEAEKLYADLKNRNEITAEDREAPAAVNALLELCRRRRP